MLETVLEVEGLVQPVTDDHQKIDRVMQFRDRGANGPADQPFVRDGVDADLHDVRRPDPGSVVRQ